MSPRLSLVFCLGAVLVAVPPAAARTRGRYPPPRDIPRGMPTLPPGVVLPDCKPQLLRPMEGSPEEQLQLMRERMDFIRTLLAGCPDDWTKTEHRCFKLNGENLTATDAAEACRRLHPRAQLACLNEEEDQELVHAMVDASPFQQAWIGLRRMRGAWQWSGRSLQLRVDGPWLPDQPDNNGAVEGCVMYDRTARHLGWTKGWNDARCDYTAPSVCEMGRDPILPHEI